MKVEGVGLGTTSIGPITGTGNFNVVKVERGFVGTLLQSTMMVLCKNLHWFIQSRQEQNSLY